MSLPEILWLLYLLASLAYWLRTAYGTFRVKGLPDLARLEGPPPARWPRLSVIVPARDEAAKIKDALSSLLATDYPDLQVIVVDDRSRDGTGEIVDRLAARDERVRATRVTELPGGWLGKLHALHRGLEASDGELILFTDADVHFHPQAIRKAVSHFEERALDHLAACPSLWPSGLLVDSIVAAFIRQLVTVILPPWKVSDPKSGAAFGVGAFNLLRRSAFERTEGLQWLRMETGDDMGLGLLMKRSGAACGVVVAKDLVGLHWHQTLRDVVRGSEKGYAVAAGCRLAPMVASGLIGLALEVSPVLGFLALLSLPWPIALPLAAANAALFAYSASSLARWARAPVLPALLAPLAAPLSTAIWLRAGLLGWWRGGIRWRDTLYPSEELRAGRRVRLL